MASVALLLKQSIRLRLIAAGDTLCRADSLKTDDARSDLSVSEVMMTRLVLQQQFLIDQAAHVRQPSNQLVVRAGVWCGGSRRRRCRTDRAPQRIRQQIEGRGDGEVYEESLEMRRLRIFPCPGGGRVALSGAPGVGRKKNQRKGLPPRRLDVQFMLTRMANWKFRFEMPTATGAPIPAHLLRTIR
jgi:hypothetical protein